MKQKLILLTLAIAAVLPCTMAAQALYMTDATTELERGKAMYHTGNYAGCADVMRALLRRTHDAALQEEIEYYIAMSCVKSGNDRVPAQLAAFQRKYPMSSHRAEIRMAHADYYYYKGEYDKAVNIYSTIDLGTLQPYMRDDWCYRLASSYLQTGKPERALPLFTALAQNSARYTNEARFFEGYIFFGMKRYNEARRSLTQVQSTSEYGNDALFMLAEIEFGEKKYARTVALGERLLDNCDNTDHITELHRITGESHFMLGNDIQAHEHLQKYIDAAESPDRSALYMSGLLAYRDNNHEKSIADLSRTVDSDDAMSQNAYLHIGLCYLQLDDTRSAMLAFEKAAATHYNESIRETALYNYALCSYESNFSMFDRTISVFEQFLNDYPSSVYIDDINSRLADLYVNSRNYRTALSSIERIKHPSRDLLEARQQILYLLGTEAFVDNRIAEAGDWFLKAVKAGNFAPEYRARSLYWLGECCYRQRAYPEALRCYNNFLNSNIMTDATTVSLAYYNIAYCHYEQKAYQKALDTFDRFVKRKDTERLLRVDAFNRIGDCYYYGRRYTNAEKAYARAASLHDNGSDYALLQQAVMAGLNKRKSEKARLLGTFATDYPQSEYLETAFNELGQTYIELNRPNEAIATYQKLIAAYPQSTSARKASLQLGMLYYNAGQTTQSITAYKGLITQFPSSKEARIAAEDLKSIYIEENKIDELTAFMQSQGKRYENAEIDSLNYLAAERNYMRSQKTDALEQYASRFPNGNFTAQACYYIAHEAFAVQNYDKALENYTTALQLSPDADFAEEALARRSEILYMRKAYDEALPVFAALEQRATTPENRMAARLGLLRTGNALNRHETVIEAAGKLLADSKLSPELKQEALYCRATAYRLSGNSGKAADDYLALSGDTRSEYGAESAYRVAQFYYDSKAYDKAETAANKFIDTGSPHAYWLARNIILLSDVYAAKGEKFKAKQYLTSLKANYPGKDDDIAERIAQRLKSL